MNDIVYLWRVFGAERNGKYLCKIGSTSRHLKDYRIYVCAESANVTANVLVKAYSHKNMATSAESLALKIGERAEIGDVDGRTEYRWLTAEQIEDVVRCLKAHDYVKRVYRRDELVNDYRERSQFFLQKSSEYKAKIVPWYDGLILWLFVAGLIAFFIFGFGYWIAVFLLITLYFRVSGNLTSNRSNLASANNYKNLAEEFLVKYEENIDYLTI